MQRNNMIAFFALATIGKSKYHNKLIYKSPCERMILIIILNLFSFNLFVAMVQVSLAMPLQTGGSSHPKAAAVTKAVEAVLDEHKITRSTSVAENIQDIIEEELAKSTSTAAAEIARRVGLATGHEGEPENVKLHEAVEKAVTTTLSASARK